MELLLENYHRQLVVLDAQIKILRQRVWAFGHAISMRLDGLLCTLCLRFTTKPHAYAHTQVQSAQEVFAINVDLHRNRVLRTTLLLTMLSTSFASAATVASFLGRWLHPLKSCRMSVHRGEACNPLFQNLFCTGMNVHNGLETHPEAFTYLVGGSCCLGTALLLTAYGLVR